MHIDLRHIAVVLVSSIISFSTLHADMHEVSIAPLNVHIPLGFDSNDNVELMITGELPDTCHLRPSGSVKIVNSEITIAMKATKSEMKGSQCIKAIIPYMVSVPLGQLHHGTYKVTINSSRQNESTKFLKVDEPSSTSIDNFTYANVLQVQKSADQKSLLISGSHPSSCMTLDRVELIPNESGDTFSVLPIVKQTKEICDFKMTPFSFELPILKHDAGTVVYHVRKIDGTALNYLL